MKNKETKKPNAFPIFINTNVNSEVHNGMTLRDYFAAKVISNVEVSSLNQGWEKEVARRAYLLADEMLKQREL